MMGAPESKAEGKWELAARKRNCYCGFWDQESASDKEHDYPLGYCGICERCGVPGHTRHFPGPVPYTGSWCDQCYRVLKWTWPFRSVTGWFYVLLVLGLGWVVVRPIMKAIWRAI
jgi:hypothetical protein